MRTDSEGRLAAKSREVRVLQQVSSEIKLDAQPRGDIRHRARHYGRALRLSPLDDPAARRLRPDAERGGEPRLRRPPHERHGARWHGVWSASSAKKRQLMRLGNLGQQRAYMSTIREQMEKAGTSQRARRGSRSAGALERGESDRHPPRDQGHAHRRLLRGECRAESVQRGGRGSYHGRCQIRPLARCITQGCTGRRRSGGASFRKPTSGGDAAQLETLED